MRHLKTYTELMQIPTYQGRYEYLREGGKIGEDTFGMDRFVNQQFYSSWLWKHDIRPRVIVRDSGHDMAMPGDEYEIHGSIIVHHLNPITMNDIVNLSPLAIDPEYMVCVSSRTHQLITYGPNVDIEPKIVERFANDTCPWKK